MEKLKGRFAALVQKVNSARAAAVVGALVLGAQAQASGGTYDEMLDAIDFSEIATGVVGAGAALIGVYLAIKGVRLIIGFVKGG